MYPKSSDDSGSADLPLDPIELAAAAWLVRQDHGLEAEGAREFERWLAADVRHARAYAQLTETWGQLDRVPADRVPLPVRRVSPWPWLAGSLAAAAALALGFYALLPMPPRASSPAQVQAQRVATAIGGFEQLALPDGSTVRLNTASEVVVDFTAGERRIILARGEASFDVAKDAARPFVVRVGEMDVRAVGTAFNVRREEHSIEVLVTEGLVQLQDASARQEPTDAAAAVALPDAQPATKPAPLLGAGQRARIALQSGRSSSPPSVADVAPAEAARALAWRSRRLEFSAEPLANIAAEFNRYNRHRLVIADAELGARRFGGKFPADDFETLVRLLETSYGVIVERRSNETVLRLAPAAR